MASASEEYIRQTQSQSNPHFQVTSTENRTSLGRRGQKNKKKKGSKSPVKEGSNYYEGKHRQKTHRKQHKQHKSRKKEVATLLLQNCSWIWSSRKFQAFIRLEIGTGQSYILWTASHPNLLIRCNRMWISMEIFTPGRQPKLTFRQCLCGLKPRGHHRAFALPEWHFQDANHWFWLKWVLETP